MDTQTARSAATAAATPERDRMVTAPVQQVAAPDFRTTLAAAFDRLGVSADARVAFGRTKAFYRAGGADWTHALS